MASGSEASPAKPRQGVLPFARFIEHAGQTLRVSGASTAGTPTPWHCQVCDWYGKTKPALVGHMTSKVHLARCHWQKQRGGGSFGSMSSQEAANKNVKVKMLDCDSLESKFQAIMF